MVSSTSHCFKWVSVCHPYGVPVPPTGTKSLYIYHLTSGPGVLTAGWLIINWYAHRPLVGLIKSRCERLRNRGISLEWQIVREDFPRNTIY